MVRMDGLRMGMICGQDGWFEDEGDLSHDENDKEDGHRRALLLRNTATLLLRSSRTLLLVPR